MSRFIQIHALTVYAPSNPNRDDTGRPKTARFGDVPRLRISSQALKRAIRLSEPVQGRLEGRLGERTQRIGEIVLEALSDSELDDEKRREIAVSITDVFGKIDEKKLKDKDRPRVQTRQLAFVSPDERAKAVELAKAAAGGEDLPVAKELEKLVLRTADGAADIAMFGRMLADNPEFNREAAVQLAHAFTTHRALVEDDFYTAVDDRKDPEEDVGAGFVGEAGFGSGVFYLYACIDRSLLTDNLAGDEELASRAVAAFVEGLAKSTPSGKRSSFAHQTHASYLLVEKGDQQPRSLAGAFLKPVRAGESGDLLEESVKALSGHREAMAKAYGEPCDEASTMNLAEDESETSLGDVAAFAASS